MKPISHFYQTGAVKLIILSKNYLSFRLRTYQSFLSDWGGKESSLFFYINYLLFRFRTIQSFFSDWGGMKSSSGFLNLRYLLFQHDVQRLKSRRCLE